jgi:hypothetical protein
VLAALKRSLKSGVLTHISEVKSFDTKDDRLGAVIRKFVGTVTK